VGDIVIFKAVTYSEQDFLRYLNERKLNLESTLKIIKVENFDLSVKVRLGTKNVILSSNAADKMLVKE
jgi:DtxR family Mn-dependent transcriptional regulator